jgi:hypothetical protein
VTVRAKPPERSDDPVRGVREQAEFWAQPVRRIRNWMERHGLPYFLVGGTVLFRHSAAEAWLQSWESASNADGDEGRTATDEATDWLRVTLGEKGTSRKDVFRAARRDGFGDGVQLTEKGERAHRTGEDERVRLLERCRRAAEVDYV